MSRRDQQPRIYPGVVQFYPLPCYCYARFLTQHILPTFVTATRLRLCGGAWPESICTRDARFQPGTSPRARPPPVTPLRTKEVVQFRMYYSAAVASLQTYLKIF